mmetsp:Transcript_22680/g.57465  ORF Transcript_22680/g.57465 Transcript_22680/m.57465 type:complete len:202 (+) Transcript_22680:836-1441(+)
MQVREDALRPLKYYVDLWNKTQVHSTTHRYRGEDGNKPCTPAHEFYDADSVWHVGACFDFRCEDRFLCFLHRRQETERAVDEADVVVDRLRDPAYGDVFSPLDAVLAHLESATVRAVAARDEEHRYVVFLEERRDPFEVEAAARRAENRPTQVLYVGHCVGGQDDWPELSAVNRRARVTAFWGFAAAWRAAACWRGATDAW